ncbi:hypothetical protein, partial [Kocuria atrinae]|uniref:hypothetical protein n=1 Tax=Kocuria atrinae TaxID=592377 RepID=UPI0031D3DE74
NHGPTHHTTPLSLEALQPPSEPAFDFLVAPSINLQCAQKPGRNVDQDATRHHAVVETSIRLQAA